MADLAHLSDISQAPRRSHDILIRLVFGILAIAFLFIVAIYRDPSNLVPSDPVPIWFYFYP
jgi:hypothetical protein